MNKIPAVIAVLIALLCCACTSSKKYDYFQQKYSSKDKSAVLPFVVKKAPEHVIEPGDVIEINSYTPDEINQSIVNSADEGEKKTKVNLFTVDNDGFIELPLVGACKVGGNTIPDIRDSVYNRISKFYNITYLQVKLHSFNINIMGEVMTPGVKMVQNNELNIIQAIALAGDISQFGNKKEVVVLRKMDGKYKIFELDITDLNVVNSEAFFLKSNDTVYVKPMRSKNIQTFTPILGVALGLLNTILILIQITRN